jgi:hypothetical protein
MKNLKSSSIGVATGALLVAAMACQNAQANQDPSLSFASVPTAQVDFLGGGQFDFTDATSGGNAGYSFAINGATVPPLAGDSIGDLGNFGIGVFTIGAITTSGSVQSAAVTGSTTVTINDGHGFNLTGTLVWDDIQTSGTGSTLNVVGNLNVTGVSYGGSSVDLSSLAAAGTLEDTVSFTFTDGQTLTQLATDPNPTHTSFSGTIATVPDGAVTMELLGGAFLVLSAVRRKVGC